MSQEEEDFELNADEAASIPSIAPGAVLFDSYTWLSDALSTDPVAPDPEQEWQLGIDEAGRGSVCGPQVYGVAFCPKDYDKELREFGFDDSKKLTAARRKDLLDMMCTGSKDLKWGVRLMTPYDLGRNMLRRVPYNLNEQSHDATILLIQEVVNRGYRVTEAFIDTVGDPERYKEKLSKRFPQITFAVEAKADAKYPITSAASIAAKVTRDACWLNWTMAEPGLALPDTIGSGYPGDARTKALIEADFNAIFGLPTYARFSWETVKVMLDTRGAKVHWNDEPATIQRYFQPGAQASLSRPQLWKDLALESPAVF